MWESIHYNTLYRIHESLIHESFINPFIYDTTPNHGNPYYNLTGAKRREWMGLGVAGMIITSDSGSFPPCVKRTSKNYISQILVVYIPDNYGISIPYSPLLTTINQVSISMEYLCLEYNI